MDGYGDFISLKAIQCILLQHVIKKNFYAFITTQLRQEVVKTLHAQRS